MAGGGIAQHLVQAVGRQFDLDVRIDQPMLQTLIGTDRLAELHTRDQIGAGGFEGMLCHAEQLGGQCDAGHVIGLRQGSDGCIA